MLLLNEQLIFKSLKFPLNTNMGATQGTVLSTDPPEIKDVFKTLMEFSEYPRDVIGVILSFLDPREYEKERIRAYSITGICDYLSLRFEITWIKSYPEYFRYYIIINGSSTMRKEICESLNLRFNNVRIVQQEMSMTIMPDYMVSR